jgi:hypothetical protein
VACSENVYGGFNSKGSACDVCDAQSEQHGCLKSTDYSWEYDAEKNLVFTQTPGAVPTFPEKAVQAPVEIPPPPPAEPKTVKTRKPRTKKQKAAPAPVVETPVVETEPAPMATITVEEPPPTGGGFNLLIGCTFFKVGCLPLVTADDILAEAMKTIEAASLKPAAQIEHFELLQGLDSVIPMIADDLASTGAWITTFQPTKGTALARLVDGLRQYADMVIVNIGM